MAAKAKDITGEKFGKLTAIKSIGRDAQYRRVWLLVCECGKEVTRSISKIGKNASCGCWSPTWFKTTHGQSQSGGLYITWQHMKDRCYNPNHVHYKYYGARGVTVCDRWLIFENFKADVGEKPSPDHTLDRHPNKKGNYEPSNFRWATRLQQARDRDMKFKMTIEKAREIRKSTLTCRELAKIYGCTMSNISAIRCGRSWNE